MDTPRDLPSALARLDALQAELEDMRPLDKDAVGRAMQRLRLEWTYHSNAIEGNSLTYGETRALLMEGVTAHGKPLKDHIDIERHRDVILFIEDMVGSDTPLRVDFVKEIHRQLMGECYEIEAETPDGARVRRTMVGGAYKELPNNVKTPTGETHFYAPPLEVPGRMAELMEWLGSDEAAALHPVARLAVFHHRFVEVHPFPDGNGRTSRVLMNVLFMRAGYVPAVLRQERRRAYYGALAEAGAGDDDPIIAFVAGELVETMELYVRAVKGEPDPDAFSRRVALLKREAEGLADRKDVFDSELRAIVGVSSVLSLIRSTRAPVAELGSLFHSHKEILMVENVRKQRLGSADGEATLRKGDWTTARVHWNLAGLRGRPDFGTSIAYEFNVRDRELEISARPVGEKWTFAPTELPSADELDDIRESAMASVLALVEQAVKEGMRD